MSNHSDSEDSDDYIIEKGKVLGEGSYGKVYEGTTIINGEKKVCAIKTNYCDNVISGTNVLRDINFHFLLRHPFIIKINYIMQGDPFEAGGTAMTPLAKGLRKTQKHDSYHFVLDKVGKDVCHVIEDEEFDFEHIDKLICYTLLAVEYCHSKGVLHRDIKLENILFEKTKNNNIKVCLTDFGLSCTPTKYRPMTPGVYTAYYRPPEICADHLDYSYPADIWALGSSFYECLSNEYFPDAELREKDDNQIENKKLLRVQIKKMPDDMSKEELTSFLQKGGANKITRDKIMKNIKKFGRFDIKKDLIEKLEEEDISISSIKKFDELCDLISKMLYFNPDKRPTATECLEHSYFDHLRDVINETRKEYPPVKKEKQVIIYDIIERKWASNILIEVYNNRSKIEWYDIRILFHSLRIFDIYLNHLLHDDNVEKGNKEIEGVGRILTCNQTEFTIWTIMYMFHKFFTVLSLCESWENFYKFGEEKMKDKRNKKEIRLEQLRINKLIREVAELEKILIDDVLGYNIFDDSLLEFMDADYDEDITQEDIKINKKEAFERYCHLREFKGTMKNLYEKLILNNN